MANFQPSGKILIGRVPFDNSYRHTLTFSSVSEQTSFMMGRMDSSLEKDTYTYVRMNNSIRVMFNAERLYTYDYVMYQNSNYGNKWFYAFIIGVNYVNENCTELVLELDVMQTWYFDYTLKQCFVEREHVDDDTVGAHLNEEPAMPLQYQHLNFERHVMEPRWGVLLLNAYMHYVDDEYHSNGVDPCQGVWAQGQYNACRFAIYDLNDADSKQRLSLDVQSLNQHGAADTIADAFTLPANCFSIDDLVKFPIKINDTWTRTSGKVWTLQEGVLPMAAGGVSVSKPSALGTYTPKNNKLLCYPYNYLEIGDFTGRVEDWRYEYFGTNGFCRLSQRMVASADCQGYVTPDAYNGIPDSPGGHSFKPFTFDFTNKISWVYSAYQNWAAQNALNNQLAILGGVGAMAFSFLPGIGAAGKMLGAGAAQMEHLGGLGLGQASQNALVSYSNAAAREFGATKPNMGALGGGLAAIASTLGNIDRMRKHPNTANGNVGGNSRLQNGYVGWYTSQVCLLPEYAAIVDDFLDMYGYQVDRVKVPNRTGRPYWNYVKCQNSCHVGNVPSDMMSQINKIYDAGITFWHTSDVGNYSLNNH
ncbi:MAG: hypothetical protein II011_00585 [Prevotella sp.]|nr:hypothetical protein [Prevotella sp.]MBQ1799229.1 hypothetical protein [Prevotella sp.]